jgi:hypothetical protein
MPVPLRTNSSHAESAVEEEDEDEPVRQVGFRHHTRAGGRAPPPGELPRAGGGAQVAGSGFFPDKLVDVFSVAVVPKHEKYHGLYGTHDQTGAYTFLSSLMKMK